MKKIPLIHKGEGHRRRLKERFFKNGLKGFHDYEVIELLLSLNTPRKDCKQSAKQLLKRFKTFQAVLEADKGSLCEIKGVGPSNSLGLRLIKEVADRYLEARIISKDVVQNPNDLLFRESLSLHLVSDQPKRLTQRLDPLSRGRPVPFSWPWSSKIAGDRCADSLRGRATSS